MSDGIMLAAERPAEFSKAELRQASLAVCAGADTADEAKMFLQMLGLI